MATPEEAIQSLRPGAEFVLYDNDVEGIQWHTPDVSPLTLAEVQAEQSRLDAAAIAQREAAIAKLAALGLTVDDLAALDL